MLTVNSQKHGNHARRKQARRYLRKSQVAERYGTTTRNIEYKVADGTLPPPEYFGRFPIWDEGLLDEYDDRRRRNLNRDQ